MNTKLLAFCLGDGTIGKDYMLQIVHCAQQKEYIEWKYSLINEEIPCSLPKFLNLIKDKHPNFDCFSHSKFQDTKTHFTDFI